MLIERLMVGIACLILMAALGGSRQDAAAAPGDPITLEAESAQISADRAEVVEQDTFASKQGVSLRAGVASNVGRSDSSPDLVFTVQAPEAGRYWIRTHAATDAIGTEAMRVASGKHDSLRLMISIDGSRPTSRVVFVPWSQPGSCVQHTGKFDFTGEEQEIRVWLPEGVRLDYLQVAPYVPPAVPDAAATYEPSIVPPDSRPRLWVNDESLPEVRASLEQGENAEVWARVRAQAEMPFEFSVPPDTEISYNASLEQAAARKAFVSLMTGDRERGLEAVALMRTYLAAVQFGNLLDITREIGRAIYSGSLVYDWCYDLMTPEERESIRVNLMRLADDMEIGWPPFRQFIVNGHGNEAQVNRDLLSMAIAIYDEDPQPYRYCAYRILEELVPMRRFEYQSPRHNQGISYGPYRFGWDLHAALLFQRMTGEPVFDENIGDVYKFWLYMRLPIGQMLRDGDGFSDGRQVNLGLTPLLAYAYTGDPIIKGDFQRQGGTASDPLLFLLLNDPNLAAEESLDALPLTIDFGPVLGSMVARTGWNMGANTSDVVVEMKGGGYHFGNHQHSDAGSFQIYYRGLQAVDLGQYHFYGTPYDMNFCKRSIAHSMLLVVDPEESFRGTTSNDGGTRFNRTCPTTAEQTMNDPAFANGRKVSASFGPVAQRPFFSYFSVDLTSAYSEKITEYVRTFCFLNLGNEQTPAALIILDNVTAANPEFRKYWQVNTLNPPEQTEDGVVLRNSALGLSGRVDVRMLRPEPEERSVQILEGEEANSVFGQLFTAPNPSKPEGHGCRVMFSPETAQASDLFLTVMAMSDENAPELPVALEETRTTFALTLADRVVVLSKDGRLIEEPFNVRVPEGGEYQLLLAGLAPGDWSIQSEDNTVEFNVRVEPEENTAFFVVPGGDFTVRPEARPEATEFQTPPDFMPPPAPALANRVFLNGNLIEVPPTRTAETCLLLPATAIFRTLGIEAVEADGGLRVTVGDRTALFRADESELSLNGHLFKMPAEVLRVRGEWFVPDSVLAAVAGLDLVRDDASECAQLSQSQTAPQSEVLWIEANREHDLQALRAMVTDIPGRREYWAAEGQDVQFDVTLVRPMRVRGIGIQWHQGSARQAKFALETSTDGVTWREVFDGASSGTSGGMETYSFDPHEVEYVRFHGYGNTANAWNSIVHFRVIPADA
ncbi:MAG: discoidin domain-containing protein [Armatimonadota bacterium]|jgi:heparin/heparan-sulfate lyase